MKNFFWIKDVTEVVVECYDWFIRLWKEEVWPLFMGISFFFVLAIPLFIVLAVLWYLNEIHWEPEHGRYKVGLDNSCKACVISAESTPSGVVNLAANSSAAAAPRSLSADIV